MYYCIVFLYDVVGVALRCSVSVAFSMSCVALFELLCIVLC